MAKDTDISNPFADEIFCARSLLLSALGLAAPFLIAFCTPASWRESAVAVYLSALCLAGHFFHERILLLRLLKWLTSYEELGITPTLDRYWLLIWSALCLLFAFMARWQL